jgi:hypothetical protein
MTTRVTIANSETSDAAHEAVITVKKSPAGGNPQVVVLMAGEEHEFVLTSELTLEVAERELT